MNITSIPVNPKIASDNSVIGTLVLAKCLNTEVTSGQNLVKMMEQSVTPNLGQNVDLKV